MLVSLFTDASHCPGSNACGYGYWVRSERGKDQGGGVVPKDILVQNSTQAEMIAALKGLHACIKSGVAQDGDHILIQVDNLNVVALIEYRVAPTDSVAREAMEKFDAFALEHNLSYQPRHIKARSGDAPRDVVHRRVDKIARRFMKEERYRRGYGDSDGLPGSRIPLGVDDEFEDDNFVLEAREPTRVEPKSHIDPDKGRVALEKMQERWRKDGFKSWGLKKEK